MQILGRSSLTRYDREFLAFHAANPKVYQELVRLARVAAGRGYRRLGVRMIWEVTRWNLMIQTNDPHSDFKLNDHYHSRYARLVMARESDLNDIFELRQLKS
jgi:hypothetical protein